jgi:hypothetical protein
MTILITPVCSRKKRLKAGPVMWSLDRMQLSQSGAFHETFKAYMLFSMFLRCLSLYCTVES